MKSEQLLILEQLAKRKNYGRGSKHAKHVMKLSLKIYDELVRLGMLAKSKEDRDIIQSAALLHDTGLPEEPHNEAGFDRLVIEIPRALSSIPLDFGELSTILYCVLWHRGGSFNKRRDIEIKDLPHVRKMAAILRIADALDRSVMQTVEDVSLSLSDERLKFAISSNRSADIEIRRADEKSDLMKEAFNLKDVEFAKIETTSATHEVVIPRGGSFTRNILLVCGGNTCRSPMAKVIFEQKLKTLGKLDKFKIDSAAYDGPTYLSATKEGRAAILILFGNDLLASHQSKKITPNLIQQADLILVMSPRMKIGLPVEKTYTLKEYAGDNGDIADPFGGNVDIYLKTAKEISDAIDKIIPKLLSQNTIQKDKPPKF